MARKKKPKKPTESEDRLVTDMMTMFDTETVGCDKEDALTLLDEVISQCEMRVDCLRDEIAAQDGKA